MRMRRVAICLSAVIGFAIAPAADAWAQPQTITIRAARVLDGKGGQLTNATVEVRDDKIVAVDQRTGPVTYDLGTRR